jgi:hypothetical protein
MTEFESKFKDLHAMLDQKESDFESTKTVLTSKLKEVEQQLIEVNNEMKIQIQE